MVDTAFVLTLTCVDAPGIVAEISTAIFQQGGNIVEVGQYCDPTTGRLFMRMSFAMCESRRSGLEERLGDTAPKRRMDWTLRRADDRQRVLILVSRFDHCLVDLLYRRRIGELPMDVVGVISNHSREAHGTVDLDGIPFHHLPVTPERRGEQEGAIQRIVEADKVDLVILARYMQILSTDLARFLSGRCINIHHSFLPGFKGARPYHQAHSRGVKLIGATAHYVTAELDKGPIIEQDVERITHADSPADLVRKGRDIERRVLARAVQFHLEGRALLNGQTTIVFRD